MGSRSDSRSCREQEKLGAKFDSKNRGHPRAAERAGERLGGLHPSCQVSGKAEVGALPQPPRCTPPGWQGGLAEL